MTSFSASSEHRRVNPRARTGPWAVLTVCALALTAPSTSAAQRSTQATPPPGTLTGAPARSSPGPFAPQVRPRQPATLQRPVIRASAAPQAERTDPTNYWTTIPDLIAKGLQVVLRVPTLSRRDVAEAVRLAQVNKGADVILITNEASFYERDSLTTQLSLMRTKTFIEPGTLEPFVIIDGVTYTGAGLIGYGQIQRLPAVTTDDLIQRTQAFIDSQQQINPVWIVQQYLIRTRNIRLK